MKIVRDIRIDYQSTPALWAATREGWEPGGLYGLGKTPTLALAELLEAELDAEAAGMWGEPTAVVLLRQCHSELRRWKSCQSIGACRQCVDDGFMLQVSLFVEQTKERGPQGGER